MEAIILPKEQFQELLNQMDEIKSALIDRKKNPDDTLLDNEEFIKLMNISKRTAQSWRDTGKISFSQVGGKVYYRMSDVKLLLDSHHKPAFKKLKFQTR